MKLKRFLIGTLGSIFIYACRAWIVLTVIKNHHPVPHYEDFASYANNLLIIFEVIMWIGVVIFFSLFITFTTEPKDSKDTESRIKSARKYIAKPNSVLKIIKKKFSFITNLITTFALILIGDWSLFTVIVLGMIIAKIDNIKAKEFIEKHDGDSTTMIRNEKGVYTVE